MNRTSVLISIVILLGFQSVQAASEFNASPDGTTIEEKARLKLYPGGVDEEDIKVQEELPNPLQKVTKQSVEETVYEELLAKDKEDPKESSDKADQ